MTSSFVRRRRLGVELRDLREARGLTTEQLGAMIHQSRMKITRLENAQVKPNLAEVMDLLEVLEVTGDQWQNMMKIAHEAARKGWWDRYGDAMGDRQRMYADIESGAATIREYHPTAMPGVLQIPAYTWALIKDAMAEGPISYVPERLVQARGERQKTVFRPEGPTYEVVMDEVGLRRFSVPTGVMYDQLLHLKRVSEKGGRISFRVFPLRTGRTVALLPKSAFFLYTFPDPADPPMAVEEATAADHVRTHPDEVAKYARRYESVRNAALSEEESRHLLSEIAKQIIEETGP